MKGNASLWSLERLCLWCFDPLFRSTINPQPSTILRSISVTVSPTGEVTVEAVGFKGASCEAATRAIEEALGKVSKRTAKQERYQAETQLKQRT